MMNTSVSNPIRDQQGQTEEEYLNAYCPEKYPSPSVATDMAIFTILEQREENYRKLSEKKLGLLLIQRGVHPFLGCWALPGGFVRPGETTEETARRELQEETGLGQVYMEQLHTFSTPDRDPRTWVMSCAYMALVDSQTAALKAGDDAANARWFSISLHLYNEMKDYGRDSFTKDIQAVIHVQQFQLILQPHQQSEDPSDDVPSLHALIEKTTTKTKNSESVEYIIKENHGLAFDHAMIIVRALERLRGKVESTDLAMHLMPDQFTLTQLQQVYEVILGKTLLKPAFRRKVIPLVEETIFSTSGEGQGHRPSKLYRRKWEK